MYSVNPFSLLPKKYQLSQAVSQRDAVLQRTGDNGICEELETEKRTLTVSRESPERSHHLQNGYLRPDTVSQTKSLLHMQKNQNPRSAAALPYPHR